MSKEIMDKLNAIHKDMNVLSKNQSQLWGALADIKNKFAVIEKNTDYMSGTLNTVMQVFEQNKDKIAEVVETIGENMKVQPIGAE